MVRVYGLLYVLQRTAFASKHSEPREGGSGTKTRGIARTDMHTQRKKILVSYEDTHKTGANLCEGRSPNTAAALQQKPLAAVHHSSYYYYYYRKCESTFCYQYLFLHEKKQHQYSQSYLTGSKAFSADSAPSFARLPRLPCASLGSTTAVSVFLHQSCLRRLECCCCCCCCCPRLHVCLCLRLLAFGFAVQVYDVDHLRTYPHFTFFVQ